MVPLQVISPLVEASAKVTLSPPFLFILRSEVLSQLLHNAENIGSFKGFPLAPTCPKVSHLLFADDLIIFAKATVKDARAIQSCIELYQLCSGQLVNAKKSAIVFSKRVPRRMQQAITRVLGLKSTPFHAKYLGLPLCNEKSRNNTLKQVVERVALKVQGWKRNLLSQASRFCYIQAVGSATSIYPMSSWLFPKNTCSKINGLLRDFWWGFKEGKRGLYLKAWDSICVPKSAGGLG